MSVSVRKNKKGGRGGRLITYVAQKSGQTDVCRMGRMRCETRDVTRRQVQVPRGYVGL